MEYLFVRILEACNAGCWFCGYAHSVDSYRMTIEEYKHVITEAVKCGIKYVRFTGGEALLHPHLDFFVKYAKEKGLKVSLITNGYLLPKRIETLANQGLDQVVVSIDDLAEAHNKNRNVKNIFENAVLGLKMARNLSVHTRVNTVCGPHNYKSMPKLQELFTELGVEYWELSALKLDNKIKYNYEFSEIQCVVDSVYKSKDKIIPYGKKWCGSTLEEQNLYFNESIPPRVDGRCYLTERIRYYDAKNRNLYVCSLLPHRGLPKESYVHFESSEDFSLDNEKIRKIVDFYKEKGSKICNGCSATAAYLGQKDSTYDIKEWEY